MTELTNTQQQKLFKILLLGDNCTDIYRFGTVDRISPEAPVPVFKFSYDVTKPGMAGNVLLNLEALGCKVNYLHGETSVKTRLIDIRSKQQIVRIDNDVESTPMEFATAIPPVYDAIVISDYTKGTVSYELIEELRKEFSGPIFIDTKKHDLARLEGCFIKVNELEYSRATSLPKGVPSGLIVTQGEKGATYNDCSFSAKTVEVADVCGAGDTFLSALVYQYLSTQNLHEAIKFAIKASAITVQHLGNYAPSIEEING
jgi:D-beta-D-heptose 7-phosphate kinase/D-beta-D-heptose 1-phosphate adenosyltransferase